MMLQLAADGRVTRARAGHAAATPTDVAFRVDVSREQDTVRIRPVGEIDLATVGPVRARMAEAMAAGAARLILDLRATTFLDSAGLHLAVDAQPGATRNGTKFAITPAPPAVQRTFDVARL